MTLYSKDSKTWNSIKFALKLEQILQTFLKDFVFCFFSISERRMMAMLILSRAVED